MVGRLRLEDQVRLAQGGGAGFLQGLESLVDLAQGAVQLDVGGDDLVHGVGHGQDPGGYLVRQLGHTLVGLQVAQLLFQLLQLLLPLLGPLDGLVPLDTQGRHAQIQRRQLRLDADVFGVTFDFGDGRRFSSSVMEGFWRMASIFA